MQTELARVLAWGLEYAESDLQKLLHHKEDTVYGDYSQALMVTLAVEIARGLAYIHSMGKMHLDLKPENVLLAKTVDTWTAKVADFGAQVINMAGAPAQPGAGGLDGSAVRGEAVADAIDPNAIDPIGTWEYMPPECWKRRFGWPDFLSDVFSFGMMLWEMFARVRIYMAFPGVEDNYVTERHAAELADKEAELEAMRARLLAAAEGVPPPQ
eukprot:COSAG04_NODE_6180_length_1391_cov_1.937307_1_plen_212_part_00